MNKIKELYLNHHIRHWTGILLLTLISVVSVNMHNQAGLYMSSLLDIPEHAPFDGTVMPVQIAPDWSSLSTSEYYMSYSDIPQSKFEAIQDYDNDYLTFPSSQLVWGNSEHNVIRNAKITYPVPYAGNYELDDCGEGCGSHPAVDIKVPEGTPVHSIANGVVVRAGNSTGFGQTVVVKHVDVPDPSNPGYTTTLYSSYSHLSEFFAAVGDEVSKNEIIGSVGASGTATTYHLHFQLDTASAPWHPYWPFTTAEASAAGYGFWDAVSAGVGTANMHTYTENPMEWIYDNMSYEATEEVVEEEAPVEEEIIVEEEEELEKVTTNEEREEELKEEIEDSVAIIDFVDVLLDAPDFITVGDNLQVELSLLDVNGNVVKTPQFDGGLEVYSTDSVATLSKNSLTRSDFQNGSADLKIYADHAGETRLRFEIAGNTFESQELYMIDEIKPFSKFGINTDGTFVPGVAENIYIQALDLNGDPTPGFYGNGDVEISVVEGDAELSETLLTKKDFPTGVAKITFTTETDDPVVIKVTYGKKVTESESIESNIFNDFDSGDDYYQAVSYLYRKGTIQGYPDGTFKPGNTVSRVEALKLIFSGLDQATSNGSNVSFSDTAIGQWYSDYLGTAYSLGVIQGYPDGSFKPTQGVNRVEFLKMLFATVDVSVDPVVSEDPYSDVDRLSWYAPYVAYAKEKNLFPNVSSNFDPSEPMSRLEVAEVIYRLIVVLDNDGESYSVLLDVE